MHVRYGVDGVQLESRLLGDLEERPHGGLFDAVLVVVPTRRLAQHLKRRIAERLGAALGIHLLTHRALALSALESALEVPPRVLPAVALVEMVEALAAEYRGADAGGWQARGGVRRELFTAFQDLREAGIGPEEIAPFKLPEPVARLYPRYAAALERLAAQGWVDEAGLARAALPHLGRFLERKRIRWIFHYGAYELIGAHWSILEALEKAAPVTFYFPGGLREPVFRYAQRFVKFFLRNFSASGGEVADSSVAGESRIIGVGERVGAVAWEEVPPPAERRAWTERLKGLYDSKARWPERILQPALEIQHCQGPEAELRLAALRALALFHGEGVPLDEIAIIARSLEPYLPFIEKVFGELEIPYATSAALPLRRHPPVAAFLGLLRLLAGDFERGAVMDYLRRGSSFLRRQERPLEVDLWDRWSRAARISRGFDAWREFPQRVARIHAWERPEDGERHQALAADRVRSAHAVVEILEDLQKEREAWEQARAVEEHEIFLRRLMESRILPLTARGGGAPEALERLLQLFKIAARSRQAASPRREDWSAAAVEELIGRIVEAEKMPAGPEEGGGVRVLDLMQARGLTQRVLIWIGFQHALFPRRPQAGLFLDDAARRRLAEEVRKPLYPKLEAGLEERLLLAAALGSFTGRLVLSYQRADGKGKKMARSSAFREVARIFTGSPDVGRLLKNEPANPFRPEHCSAHAGEGALALARSPRFGLCPFDQALAAAAVGGQGGPAAARSFLKKCAAAREDRLAALEAVEVLEKFGVEDLRFDGFTSIPPAAGRPLSPTVLERLARCPQAFFLRDVLQVHELDPEARPHRLEMDVLGLAAHEAMKTLYAELAREKSFPIAAPQLESVRERARVRLEEVWNQSLKEAAGPSFQRLAGFYRILGGQWLSALQAFLERDLEELSRRGVSALELEVEVSGDLKLPGKVTVPLRGRLDRLLHGGGGLQIEDYKTAGDLKRKADPKEIVRGNHLQLPLYRELVAAARGLPAEDLQARFLGLGPRVEAKEVPLELDGRQRQGFLETVAVVLALAEKGNFPIYPDPPKCRYCAYQRVCRKNHPPTLSRFELNPQLADFRDLKEKDKKQVTLEAVRRARLNGPAEEGAGS